MGVEGLAFGSGFSITQIVHPSVLPVVRWW